VLAILSSIETNISANQAASDICLQRIAYSLIMRRDPMRIRVKLTTLLQPGSKLRWLLSETLVVVLGVLIALGLNDYWIARQERALELQYLKRIHADVSADIQQIDFWVGEQLQRKLQALDTIAPIVRGNQPVPEDVESFLRNVALGGIGGASSTHWVADTTFEDMKSTGNLRLIRNADLRTKIARYYDDFDALYVRSRDRKSGYVMFVHSLLPAELRDDMSFTSMKNFDVDRALDGFRSAHFQNLMNQEYNYLYFNLRNDNLPAKQLTEELLNYIQQLEGEDSGIEST